MKDYKMLLAALALGLSILVIGIFTISVFNYIAFLKEQNYALLDVVNHNISQIQKSIGSLEANTIVAESVALKAENLELKKENQRLKAELARLGERQRAAAAEPSAEVPAARKDSKKEAKEGNRGFLFRKTAAE